MHPTKEVLAIPNPARPDKQPLEVVERVVMMSLLAEKRRWPLAELKQWINEEQFDEAVASLKDVGLLCREGDVVFASPAAIRGDDLS
jgi:hypothetical protein